MCGCDCCQNSNPTCFDPQSMEANGSFHGWACRCSCPGCIARVIDGAMAVGYGNAMDDGWGEPEHIKAAVAAARTEEQQRINSMLVVDYVREQYERGAADKAAELQDYYGEQAHGHYMDGYKMGYAKGLIEGDSGGRKEGFRVGYDTAWSLSAAEIERATEARVREEEQVAQTLARAELYSMEEMDERCTQAADEAFAVGVQAARDAVAALSPPWAVKFYVNRPSNGEWIGCNGAHEEVDVLAAIDALTTSGKEGNRG